MVHLSLLCKQLVIYFNFEYREDVLLVYECDVPCPGLLPSSDFFKHVCDLCVFLTHVWVNI